MRDIHTSNAGEGASLSRRNFLSIAAAGAAATSPAVALAEASGKTSRLPQPSLEQQLDICIANLKNVLAAMHPEADDVRHLYIPQNNGRSYIFGLSGYAPALGVWDGAGLYEIGDSQKLPAGIYFVDRH